MIITLCGSARFEDEFHAWNEHLTLRGHTVFSLAVFPSTKGKKDWYDAATKIALDVAHLQKIDASEAIFVIVSDGTTGSRYIGESTDREIKHAFLTGKRIVYSDEYEVGKDLGPYYRLDVE